MYEPPAVIKSEVFTRLPETFRDMRLSSWAEATRGRPMDCNLEGPSFDRDGNLYLVDIPNGRIMRVSAAGTWDVVAEYDGWPNGLKIHKDGRLFVADHMNGIVRIDPATGAVEPVLRHYKGEWFKGVNDLVFAMNGDLYFTDQGQTGWQDPTGRVFRLTASGALDPLVATVPSPNGLVLNLDETELYVAVTRANAVWRVPLASVGTSRVGTFIQLSGGIGGPDGLALDVEGGIIVAQLGIGVVRFDSLGRPTHLIELAAGRRCTNIAFGGPENRHLFITESETGSILRAELPVPGRTMYSHAE
ncbi:MAG: SMP-30/gluconolactonase/LRE family protein [Rhodospirillales bacterium]|nr:SMP-30/gluconolactonase/LRE family protein [Rhodospirillales bacterium]